MRHVGGNPGRGSHRMSLDAGRILFETRESIAALLNAPDSSRIVFTKNATEAINVALKGLLQAGDHIITTSLEHNAVINTVRRLEGDGIKVTMLLAGKDGKIDLKRLERAITPETKLVCITHASNVLGTVLPVADIGVLCRNKKVRLMVDAAQTAGALPIDVEGMNIDILAAAGHKALFGPQGTGFLYLREGIEPPPLVDGGTGGGNEFEELPERLESGTVNTPGIGGLGAGIDFVLKEGLEHIREYEEGLMTRLIEGLKGLNGVHILGIPEARARAALLSFTLEGTDPGEVSYILDNDFTIMVRSGLHCAPYAHRTAGTFPAGTVRVSPGYLNSHKDIEEFLSAIKVITAKK